MEKQKVKKVYRGVVISDKMDKSRVVVVETIKKHPLYKKYLVRKKKYMVHDEKNESKVGDRVLFMETRPLSKRKRWTIIEVINKTSDQE